MAYIVCFDCSDLNHAMSYVRTNEPRVQTLPNQAMKQARIKGGIISRELAIFNYCSFKSFQQSLGITSAFSYKT